MNTITELLDLEDSDLSVSEVQVKGTQKLITLETPPVLQMSRTFFSGMVSTFFHPR